MKEYPDEKKALLQATDFEINQLSPDRSFYWSASIDNKPYKRGTANTEKEALKNITKETEDYLPRLLALDMYEPLEDKISFKNGDDVDVLVKPYRYDEKDILFKADWVGPTIGDREGENLR